MKPCILKKLIHYYYCQTSTGKTDVRERRIKEEDAEVLILLCIYNDNLASEVQ